MYLGFIFLCIAQWTRAQQVSRLSQIVPVTRDGIWSTQPNKEAWLLKNWKVLLKRFKYGGWFLPFRVFPRKAKGEVTKRAMFSLFPLLKRNDRN